MAALRLASILALGVWAGGVIVLGAVAAPEMFRVLELLDPASGRDVAGRLFGSVFGSFQRAAWIAGGVVLASLGLRAALGPRPARLAIRIWTTTAMLAASVATVYVITPAIDAIRIATPVAIASLAPTDPVRVYFGRLHGASTGLALLTVAAGLGLMWAEIRDRH